MPEITRRDRRAPRWALLSSLVIASASGCADNQEPSGPSSGAGPQPTLGRVFRNPTASGNPDIRQERNGTFSRALSEGPVAPGAVRYAARIQTDATGRPIVRATPDGEGEGGSGYFPSDLQNAYSIPINGGSGTTVGIVDANDDPNAESDLAVYRARFNLPPCTTANGCFRKVGQSGTSALPSQADPKSAVEIMLDIEMVSAACPLCKIVLVEANSLTLDDMLPSNDTATDLGASFVSNSWGGPEPSSDWGGFHQFASFFASSGDSGYGVGYPASSAFVTAVGGTSLVPDASNPSRPWRETAWSGAGSGCSGSVARPSWQQGTNTDCSMRAEADISAVADPADGVAVFDTFGLGGWGFVGGTSVASPLVAAIFAATETEPSPSFSYQNPQLFNDVVSGSNGTCGSVLCNSNTGWDGPTGNGTPNGAALCPPQITGISPSSGPLGGGTQVTISGTCLFGISSISFSQGPNGATAAFTNTFDQITLTTPADPQGIDGVAEVIVWTSAGSASTDFTYQATPPVLSPKVGPTIGGTQVTITGEGFDMTPGHTTATFGGVAASSVYCASTTSCLAVAPAHGLGAVPVVLSVNGSAQPAATTPFTYQGPGITSISPSSGPIAGGTTLDLFGTGFDTSMQVFFGGVASPYVLCQSSTWCIVHSSTVASAGPAEITLELPGNVASVPNPPADVFTYTQLATLTDIDLDLAETTPYTLVGGEVAPGIVGLNGAAPSGGATVLLTSSDPSTVTVPSQVVIAAGNEGNTANPFPVTVVNEDVSEAVTITATYQGTSVSMVIDVIPTPPVKLGLGTFSVLSTHVDPGTITLSEPAPAGAVVALASSNPSAATVPATVPVTGTSGSFTVTALNVTTPQNVTITASYFGVTSSIQLQILPWTAITVTVPGSVTAKSSVTGTITLGTASSSSTTVTLASSSFAAVPTSPVVIPAFSTTGTFTVYGEPVSSTTSVQITATCNAAAATCANDSASTTLEVLPGQAPPLCCPHGCPSGKVCSNVTCSCVLPKL